jgi:hypothetical protein
MNSKTTEKNVQQSNELIFNMNEKLNDIEKKLDDYLTQNNSGKKQRTKKEKDPNAPKGPRGTWLMFSNKNRESYKKNNPTLNNKELTQLMASEWKKLPDSKKKKYIDMANKDKERYEKEKEEYEKSLSQNSSGTTEKKEVNKESKKNKEKESNKNKKQQKSNDDDDDLSISDLSISDDEEDD